MWNPNIVKSLDKPIYMAIFSIFDDGYRYIFCNFFEWVKFTMALSR